jgi:sugar transferase (PEP-CTERM/EpsH1 system associated)
MRVLYLCHRIPYPPDKGDKIRAFHQLKAMGERHELDLFTLADDSTDLAHKPVLRRYCRTVTVAKLAPAMAKLRALPFLFTRTPLTLPYFYSAQLQREISRAMLARSYDRIFVYASSMAQYASMDHGPVLMDFVDVDSDKWIQYAAFQRFPFSAVYRREGRRLRAYEQAIAEKAACVLVTTEREAKLVRQLSADARVHVVPNGVDTAYFDAGPGLPHATEPVIVFTGDLSYFPNIEAVTFFALEVLPIVRGCVRDARFVIVGRNPGPEIQRLRKVPGVEITGFVPDVRPYLANARVSVAPFSIAAGIQNKILEALAYSLPVVATPRAVQGFSAPVAEVIEIADDAEGLARKTVRFLCDEQHARSRGVEGRRRVIEHYSWDRALDRLLQLLEHPAGTEAVACTR